MIRRSISCMLAGLLIAGPIWYVTSSETAGWQPHGWLRAAIFAVPIAGIIWLYDELTGN